MSRVFALSLALLRLLLLVTADSASVDKDADLDDLLGAVFPLEAASSSPTPTTPRTKASCPEGQQCIPKYLCMNETTNGEELINIRFSESNPCVDYLQQCCLEEDIITELPKATTVEPPGGDHQNQSAAVCGRRNTNGIVWRITGAEHNESEYGEFPWMVAVMRNVKVLGQEVNLYLCGGSIIHPSVVLTAVHCVQLQSPDQVVIRAGEWDTQTGSEVYPYQDRPVEEIVAHPDYYKGGLFNDLAMIVLKTPFDFNQAVQTVCLPPPDVKFDFQRCLVSGWGKDVFGKAGLFQAILKKIDLPIVPHGECQDALRTVRKQPGFVLHESFLCAGGEIGKDACQGDGGSPLVCAIEGSGERYHQVGIVVWGVGCGGATPGLYADVSHLRGWIDQEMRKRELDTSSYSHS